MKIALQYCGLPRWTKAVVESQFNKLMIPADAQLDVFCAFWRVDNVDYGKLSQEASAIFGKPPVVMHVIDGYMPAVPANVLRFAEVRPENVYKMYRAIAYVNQVRADYARQQGLAYDIVIRSRTDIMLDRPLPLTKLVGVAQHCIVLPSNGHWRGGLNDQFAIAKPSDMDYYSGTHDNLDTYLATGAPLHPEQMLRRHLEAGGISSVFGDFSTELYREPVLEPLSTGTPQAF